MKADYSAMLDMYDKLNGIVDNMVDSVKKAKDIVNKLNDKDYWDGKGYDAYYSKFKKLTTNYSANLNELYKVNSTIKKAVSKYQETDANLTTGAK